MTIEGFIMRRGVKERKGVNETPRRGGSVVVFTYPLGLALYL